MAPVNTGRGHRTEAMNMDEEGGSAILDRIRRSMGPEIVELLLKSAGAAPLELRDWPPERMFQYLRCRLRFTQNELAQKAGLTQSQVSRIESGADCQLSTWTRAYAAMGFDLRLLPASDLTLEELNKRAEQGRPHGHWMKERSRPRRIWRDGSMLTLPGGRPSRLKP